jgi:hypothetical protein
MRVVGGSPGGLAARLRKAIARTPPDKGYKGLTSLSVISTTPKTPFSDTCVVLFDSKRDEKKCVTVASQLRQGKSQL